LSGPLTYSFNDFSAEVVHESVMSVTYAVGF